MTTTDIATHDESSLTMLPPARPGAPAALQMLASHVEVMAQAKHLAKAMVLTDMVPTRFQGEEHTGDAAAAILYGLELGLTPIQSLQRVIPIHGMPSIEARTMAGLLMSRGYTIRAVVKNDDLAIVHGWMPGRNPRDHEPDAISEWTIDRAVQAGYVPTPVPGVENPRPSVKTDWLCNEKSGRNGKYYTLIGNMKYITDPRTMLAAKGTAEVCRDLAPDVLLGISYSREDLESERWDDEPSRQTVRAERESAPRTVTVDEILGDVDPGPAPAKPKRKRPSGMRERTTEPEQEPQDAEVVEDTPADNASPPEPSSEEPKPEPAQVSASDSGAKDADSPADAPTDDLRKKARGKLTGAIFSMFGHVVLRNGDDEYRLSDDAGRDDRLVVIEAIVGRPVKTSTDLTDDELQNLRNSLYSRQQAGTLDADVNDWLNLAAIREADAKEAAAQSDTTTEGNN